MKLYTVTVVFPNGIHFTQTVKMNKSEHNTVTTLLYQAWDAAKIDDFTVKMAEPTIQLSALTDFLSGLTR
jgi:hypothetical protein